MKRKIFLVAFVLLFGISTLFGQKNPGVKINGRIQYDFNILKRENADKMQIGNEFRRVHLSAAGKLNDAFKYKVEVNFAHGSLGFRDVYIQYEKCKLGKIAVGSKAEPTGLDIGTSSKYIPFVERAMLTALQDFRWGTGIHFSNTSLLDGKAGIQAALTNKGKHSEGFLDKNFQDGANMMARVFVAPLMDKDNNTVVHLGANYASRPYKDLKFRPENHMGSKYHYTFDGGTRRFETGFETAIVYKQFSLQGEYKTQTVANDVNKNYKTDGYYAMASFFVTGESRPYKKGAFGRVKPAKDISNGGLGAIELLVRYSSMNFSQDVVDLPANAGMPQAVNNIGFGLNWYLTSHVRVMYNFIITDDGHTDGKLNAHLVRFALDF
jgi:phosphate-selective porin OprO/OprP